MTKNTLKLLGWFYKRKFEHLNRAQKVDYLSIEYRLRLSIPPPNKKSN
jgi:hypothetical protein